MSKMTGAHVMRAALLTRSQAIDLYPPEMHDPWTAHFTFFLERHINDEMFRALANGGCRKFRPDGTLCPGPDGAKNVVCMGCAATQIVRMLNDQELEITTKLRDAGFEPDAAPFGAIAMPRAPLKQKPTNPNAIEGGK